MAVKPILLLVTFFLIAGCKPSATVETHIVKILPESYSFMSKNTKLLVLPVLTREVKALDGECKSSQEIEKNLAELFPKLGIIPFEDICLFSSGESSMSSLINIANGYFINGTVDSGAAHSVAEGSPENNPSHLLLFKVEKNNAWKDLKGRANKSMIIRGSLYELSSSKIIFEFMSAGKSTEKGNIQAVDPQKIAELLVTESIKLLPYDPAKAFKEPSSPDF
ncbi:MAG: hypothetical protein JNL74_17310 [Fibrobacteres bacterium]|nr:hypothetical protein [Fibrobacterota bacterium]